MVKELKVLKRYLKYNYKSKSNDKGKGNFFCPYPCRPIGGKNEAMKLERFILKAHKIISWMVWSYKLWINPKKIHNDKFSTKFLKNWAKMWLFKMFF